MQSSKFVNSIGRLARSKVQSRQFSIFDRKNTIAETRQKYYSNEAVGAENPTYLKEPGDKMVVLVAIGGVAVGVVGCLIGLFNMSFGIGKKK